MQFKSMGKEVKTFSNSVFLPEVVRLLNAGHTITINLRGVSMRPFLEDKRDKALLKKVDKLTKGAPVLAEIKPGFFVLHRIIKLDGKNVTLRGDGNLNTESCLVSDVKAEVIGFYRKGRSVLDRTSGLKWRIYSFLWVELFPLFFRRCLLYLHRKVKDRRRG